jgi:hypothetical protein
MSQRNVEVYQRRPEWTGGAAQERLSTRRYPMM